MNSLPFTRGIRAIVQRPRWDRRIFPSHTLGRLWVELDTSGGLVSPSWCLAIEIIGEHAEDLPSEFGLFPTKQIIRPSHVLAGLVYEVKIATNTSYLELGDHESRFVGFYRSGNLLEPCVWGYHSPDVTRAYIPADQCFPPAPEWRHERRVEREFQEVSDFRHFLKEMGLT